MEPQTPVDPNVEVIASAAQPGTVVDPSAEVPHIPMTLEGGPQGEVIASDPVVDPVAPLFTYGNKTFATQEELKAFIDDLDRKAAKGEGYEEAMKKIQASPPVPEVEPAVDPDAAAPALVIDGENIDEMIWTDPGKALSLVQKQAIEQATKTVEARQVTTKALDDFWADFYSKNKDLDDVRDHVQMVLAKNQPRLYAMDSELAKTELATLTRAELSRVHDKFKDTEVLGSATAQVAAPTGAPAPATPAPEVIKNVAFIDQVKQYQSKYFTDRVS